MQEKQNGNEERKVSGGCRSQNAPLIKLQNAKVMKHKYTLKCNHNNINFL